MEALEATVEAVWNTIPDERVEVSIRSRRQAVIDSDGHATQS